jgi:hypothetical protein
MHITRQDRAMGVRQPTVSRNTSLGREFHRSATWQEGDTTVSVTVIAFVTGIRTRKNPDGSEDLLGQVTRFDVLRKDEYVKPVERAVFLWERERDGVRDTAMDYTNEIGLFYSATLEDAEEQCQIFMENLDFSEQFDPAAWV